MVDLASYLISCERYIFVPYESLPEVACVARDGREVLSNNYKEAGDGSFLSSSFAYETVDKQIDRLCERAPTCWGQIRVE